MKAKSYPFIKVQQTNRHFFLTRMPADHLTRIAYASVRGESQEEGAVQRLLNPRRIASVKEFTLAGGDYPSCIVLNLVAKGKLKVAGEQLTLADEPRLAQIIDGQHRVAGMAEAIKANSKLARLEIPVAIYEGLDSTECADIFLAINTEQKPVARTLVFDLYGIASKQLVDSSALRARDIAIALNDFEESPYQGMIKLPGSPRVRGGIALSTVVTGLKPLIDPKGPLDMAGISELSRQTSVFINLFSALKDKYGDQWDTTDNPFVYASGFMGALQLFRNKIIDYCSRQRSFSQKTISSALRIAPNQLLKQSEVRGQSGSSSVSLIYDRLFEAFDTGTNKEEEIEI